MGIPYVFALFGFERSLEPKWDDTDPLYTYLGYAYPTTATGKEGWAIIRLTKSEGGNPNLGSGRWANGQGIESLPRNGVIWDNRATGGYTYEP
jgi:hypothetical protein